MQFRLEPLLSSGQVGELRLALLAEDAPWRDGAETAGWHAREVKRNRQLEPASSLNQTLASALSDHLLQHPLLQAAALPVRLHSLRFSRCGVGEGYGRHVDNAFMVGGRSDLSFTLFLSEPEQYDGGALVLEDPGGESALRLPAGHALVYPSSLLHRVDPVTRGERLVALGWIQSRVRRSDRRELLFELDTARRSLYQKQGKDEIFDLLTRSYTNLLRMWGE
ncbi:Fe2+-dependent dioxygenase [Cyanobium sp. Candia 9D4]|uniref:Fe2+-dependent dioxygenase n=1 Tax=Cyanobium sp. Candia 9D4 TaxID=2823707 RepID=UPI0020CC0D77|nr:Fe2+-dependent dioxygenase [Cyanobium sp. Candia 9D4]MCP9935168.1 Fe2+-dependent dioxygenase [Cyanobium sp. Candia 9D4]